MAVVDGQLIENLHVAEAQHMVALADRITAAATAADCG
jgi:hypothetical protein